MPAGPGNRSGPLGRGFSPSDRGIQRPTPGKGSRKGDGRLAWLDPCGTAEPRTCRTFYLSGEESCVSAPYPSLRGLDALSESAIPRVVFRRFPLDPTRAEGSKG